MRKIKKILVNLIVLFIWHRPTRHRVRDCLMNFRLSAWIQYIRFTTTSARPNSILLAEFNDCHGEVISGMLPYFKKLGYNIDILINNKVLDEKPFCRQNMTDIRIYKTWTWGPNLFLNAQKTKNYKIVLLMTSACYFITKPDGGYGCMLPFFKNTGVRPYVIEHDLNDVMEFNEENLIREKRLITLGKFNRGIFINPHSFGDVKILPKNQITTFITVGNIEGKRKNFNILPDAIDKLVQETHEFKVIIIGRGTLNDLPASVRPYVEITGRLNFPQMFEKLEQADFFLPLLDADCRAHDRYLTAGVTGSAQLIYGFAKIAVIDRKFASFYRFNDKNAIIYNRDIVSAMRRAIDTNAEQYHKMQTQLRKTADAIADESLENLKRILNEK